MVNVQAVQSFVGGVGPVTLSVDAELAVCTGLIGLNFEARLAAVHIADRQLAAGAQGCVGLFQAFGSAAEHGLIVDSAQGEALLHCCALALTIADGVAQGDRAVVVRIGREAVGAFSVIRQCAVRCRHITDAERAALHVAVAIQQLRHGEGVNRVFHAFTQCLRTAAQCGRVIHAAQAEALADQLFNALAIQHFVSQRDGAVVVGLGREGEGAIPVVLDAGVVCAQCAHAQAVAIDIAVALQQLFCSDLVGLVFSARFQDGRPTRQDRLVVDGIKLER